MDSQRDLSRSLLRATLRQQAAVAGGAPIGIQQHLARPITAAEVATYADQSIPPGGDLFGADGLARTLQGALQPLMVGFAPVVKRVVSTATLGRASTPRRASHRKHGDRHTSVSTQKKISSADIPRYHGHSKVG